MVNSIGLLTTYSHFPSVGLLWIFHLFIYITAQVYIIKKTKSMLIFCTFRKRDNVTITVSEEDRRVRGQGEARLTVN